MLHYCNYSSTDIFTRILPFIMWTVREKIPLYLKGHRLSEPQADVGVRRYLFPSVADVWAPQWSSDIVLTVRDSQRVTDRVRLSLSHCKEIDMSSQACHYYLFICILQFYAIFHDVEKAYLIVRVMIFFTVTWTCCVSHITPNSQLPTFVPWPQNLGTGSLHCTK